MPMPPSEKKIGDWTISLTKHGGPFANGYPFSIDFGVKVDGIVFDRRTLAQINKFVASHTKPKRKKK